MIGMATTTDPLAPFEQERELNRFLTQETRFAILQYVLGHPHSLPSSKELDHLIPQKSATTITEAVDALIDRGILAEYTHEPNRGTRGFPTNFYGLTERGVEILDTFNLLRGRPVMRAVYRKFDLPEAVRRHQDAPRPPLPSSVATALASDE